MGIAKLPPLQRQLERVHRRMIMQQALRAVLLAWSSALFLATAWFLVQPLLFEQAQPWLRWAVAGGIFCGATIGAVCYCILHAPDKLNAALSLDSAFGLKERVTTSLTLEPGQAQSSVGLALLADVNQRIESLDVGSQFPIRLGWDAVLLPLGGMALALVAAFYAPEWNKASAASTRDPGKEPPPNSAEIEKKVKDLQKKLDQRQPGERNKSEELKNLEAELDKIANKPFDSKDQVRERIKEMSALEEVMKSQEREMADRSRALKQQLQRMDQMGQKVGEGPAKDLQKALAEGKMDRAREEVEKLAKKLQANQLSEKEKEMLKKQLEEMQQKLERMASLKDREEKLKQMNLDPETLKRELDQLKKDSQKLKDLQQLANQLNKCQQSLKEGNMEGASMSLSEAGNQMKNMEMQDDDLADLRDQLKKLQGTKEACDCQGDKEGDPAERDSDQDSNNGGIGAGKRPLGKAAPFRSFDTKPKVEFDEKGKKVFEGYAPGQTFRRKSGPEMVGEVKQSSQEAPEAIEQQRIPKAARDMAKGYFQRMREQAEKEAPKQP